MSLNRFESMAPLLYATPGEMASIGAMPGSAATVVLDIHDDWTKETIAAAVSAARDTVATDFAAFFLRIGLPDGRIGQEALERLAAVRPDGFALAGCGDAAWIQKLDVMLRVAEAECGISAGALGILAEVGAEPGFLLSSQSLNGVSQRLQGIVLDAGALTRATQSQTVNAATGLPGAPLVFARAAAVIQARQAGLACHDRPATKHLSDDDMRALRDAALADGFSGVVAHNVTQLSALLTR